jgi:hypothetical protein
MGCTPWEASASLQSALRLRLALKLNKRFHSRLASSLVTPAEYVFLRGVIMTLSANSERRAAFRRTCLLSGTIRFATRTSTMTCRIRNLSETGTRLRVANAYWLPDRFELEIMHHDIRVPAKVIWRNGEEVGVVFTSNRPGMMTSPTQDAQILSLKAETERLKTRVRQLSEE